MKPNKDLIIDILLIILFSTLFLLLISLSLLLI
jgi:hypothetical protein